MNNPVGWFEIYVDDMARAKAFYEAVFGKKLERLDNEALEMWAFPMNIGAPGASYARRETRPAAGVIASRSMQAIHERKTIAP